MDLQAGQASHPVVQVTDLHEHGRTPFRVDHGRGCEGDVQCGIALVFSIDQGLSIVNDHGHVSLDMDMLGLRTHQEWYGCDEDCSLTVERRGDSVLFLSAGRQLYSLTFPSIASSVSISFFCRGCGQVTFSFS